MRWMAAILGVLLVGLLVLPWLARPSDPRDGVVDGPTLVIITPHTEQIRYEYERAFSRWHEANFGEPVRIDWRAPGGTSEIRRLLIDQYQAAIRNGEYEYLPDGEGGGEVVIEPGRMGYDLLFGGGSYEHGQMERGFTANVDVGGGATQEMRVPISVPAGFSQEQLDEWFGLNEIGNQLLYQPEQYWIGTALSGFGIIFNIDLYTERGMETPTGFEDLTDPRLMGLVALADPRQSGSITTTFDSILNAYGWDDGWRILRELAANTRYFTSAATKPPLDVAAGEAMAGLAIDFYGRTQSQAVTAPGAPPESSRVGYVDPVGAVYIDADPASILRGGPNPELARRFIEFCLTEQAQSLWQFPANPEQDGAEPVGPERYELRRAPVRRVMYEKYADRFIDRLDPFAAAAKVDSRGWRSAIPVMMGAFGVDSDGELQRAWAALWELRERAAGDPSWASVLAEAETAFYAFPTQEVVGEDNQARVLEFNEQNYRPIRNVWRDPEAAAEARIAYMAFFRDRYREVEELASRGRPD
ncbi:MAG: ABC transporter substrate-binding protein [Phycisphaerales bacterium]